MDDTVEYLRRDNRAPVLCAPPLAPSPPAPPELPPYLSMSTPKLFAATRRDRVKAIYEIEVSVASVRFVPRGDADGM